MDTGVVADVVVDDVVQEKGNDGTCVSVGAPVDNLEDLRELDGNDLV
jgi:hypothetical protein